MKKAYVRPVAECEVFVANDYVAACGKKDGKYIFTCDAPAGTVYYYNNSTRATRLGGYHPCAKQHVTEGPSGYYDGFVDYNNNGKEDPGEASLIWVERDWFGSADDWHASASLTRESIEVERS